MKVKAYYWHSEPADVLHGDLDYDVLYFENKFILEYSGLAGFAKPNFSWEGLPYKVSDDVEVIKRILEERRSFKHVPTEFEVEEVEVENILKLARDYEKKKREASKACTNMVGELEKLVERYKKP